MLKKVLVTSLVTAAMIMAAQVAGTRVAKAALNTISIGMQPDDQTQVERLHKSSDEDCASALLGVGGGDEVREEFHQTYPLSENGRLILENLNGEVKISVWDRNEVQVNAVKRAYNRERLAEAKIEVSASPDVLRLKTRYPDYDQRFNDDEKGRYHNPATIDYSLTVPRRARLESIELVNGSLEIEGVEGDVKAASVNGRVTARGLMGEARLTTVNGSVEAVFTRLDESKQISLDSVNGNVLLIIPSSANAVIRASTVHGGISNEFGLDVQQGDYIGHELYGQIGSGGPRIKLGNVNGGIQIKHSQDGGNVSPSNSLLSQKDKEKDKYKDKIYGGELSELTVEARKLAEEARREALVNIDQARMERQVEAETRREVDRAIREAQREIQRAQMEVQRETERQLREQLRDEARGGVGGGAGRGAEKGVGHGAGEGGGRFIDKETKTFVVSGTPQVNVVTYDGGVVVHGWDKSEVMYTATKRANDEQEVKEITIKSEQQGSMVSIIASTVEDNGSTNLEVYLPRNVSLHVSSGDGTLRLEGVSGDLTLRTGDGSIDVANAHGTLQVNTGDGPIKVVRFEGQADARTGDGPISLDGRFTALSARTGSGSIDLAVPADLNFTLETNAEDVTNNGLTITEDLAPSKRVRRWKVGQGGKVFVISTGDGRIIIRPQ